MTSSFFDMLHVIFHFSCSFLLVGTNEKEYQTQRLDEVSNTQLAEALAKMPILMQRPIVVKGDIALIGRPPEIILEILG